MAISNSMSYCREDGKDRIIFMTKEDYEQPPKVFIPDEDDYSEYEEPGLILPNGDINWNCPCLGGIASGPCSVEFKEAFSCFHYSEAEPKGSDCFEPFKVMSECMSKYPTLYPEKDDPMDFTDEDPDRMGHSGAPVRGDVVANADESSVEESNPTESVSSTENVNSELQESTKSNVS